MSDPIPPLKTMLWRGAQCKCPQCGRGALFKRWNKTHDQCAVCGLKFLENQGDLWGLLLIIDRALFILPLVAMIYFKWYNPASVWFYVFCGGMIFGLLYTLPHRTGMCLAVDYRIRRESEDPPAP